MQSVTVKVSRGSNAMKFGTQYTLWGWSTKKCAQSDLHDKPPVPRPMKQIQGHFHGLVRHSRAVNCAHDNIPALVPALTHILRGGADSRHGEWSERRPEDLG